MYFWNYKILAEKLHHNQLTEKDKFKYLLACTILMLGYIFILSQGYAANHIAANHIPESLYASRFWMSITFSGFEVFALFLFYIYNQKGDGKNFIERYIVLSLPIMIKTILMGALITLLIICGIIFFLIKFNNFTFEEALFMNVMPFSTIIIYSLSLYYHINAAKIASGIKKIKDS